MNFSTVGEVNLKARFFYLVKYDLTLFREWNGGGKSYDHETADINNIGGGCERRFGSGRETWRNRRVRHCVFARRAKSVAMSSMAETIAPKVKIKTESLHARSFSRRSLYLVRENNPMRQIELCWFSVAAANDVGVVKMKRASPKTNFGNFEKRQEFRELNTVEPRKQTLTRVW